MQVYINGRCWNKNQSVVHISKEKSMEVHIGEGLLVRVEADLLVD